MSQSTEQPLLPAGGSGPSLVSRLREETRPDHARVDAAFSRFDLTRRGGYAAFLTAQARVLPALEALLRPGETIPGWHGRAALLLQDLGQLGAAVPTAHAPDIQPGHAAWWGALYVMEGSRLGGAMLARRVPSHLPYAFLGASHPPGAWRGILARIDQACLSPSEQSASIKSAQTVFDAFEQAAYDQA